MKTDNSIYRNLMAKPACTLTALEQYVLYRWCDENFEEVLRQFMAEHPGAAAVTKPSPETKPDNTGAEETVRGIGGLAQALGIGKTKANEIVQSGRIDKAIWRDGRVVCINVRMAKSLLSADKDVRKASWRV